MSAFSNLNVLISTSWYKICDASKCIGKRTMPSSFSLKRSMTCKGSSWSHHDFSYEAYSSITLLTQEVPWSGQYWLHVSAVFDVLQCMIRDPGLCWISYLMRACTKCWEVSLVHSYSSWLWYAAGICGCWWHGAILWGTLCYRPIFTYCSLVMSCAITDLNHTDSANGLLPDGTKPFPEPMLMYHQ